MIRRILATIIREYTATALTPAFLFAVVAFPAILIGGIFLISATGILSSKKAPLEGTIGVADLTTNAVVSAALKEQFDPQRQQQIAQQPAEEVQRVLDESMPPGMASMPQTQMAAAMLAGREAIIDIEDINPDADVDATKARLYTETDTNKLLALIIASDNSVATDRPAQASPTAEDRDAQPGNTFASTANDLPIGSYDIFVGKGFDAQARRDIERSIDRAIIDERMRQAGLDPELVAKLRRSPRAQTATVTEDAETESMDELQFFVPVAFMMLLWISVMTGGQYLLMSTIEEKSSRVMEVLLSAISPTELLTGKILGQGLVGLTVLAVYASLGLTGVAQLGPQLWALLPWETVPWLIAYFLIAYGLFACLMAAIGSAVSDVREAQSLLGPIMMLLMFPLMLWFFIVDNPNSLFATVLSYIPFTTPFVMILRVSQTVDPVPMWQIITTTLVGIAGVVAVGWAAVKIFRIGVLMYGKPPSFMGLLKWLRHG